MSGCRFDRDQLTADRPSGECTPGNRTRCVFLVKEGRLQSQDAAEERWLVERSSAVLGAPSKERLHRANARSDPFAALVTTYDLSSVDVPLRQATGDQALIFGSLQPQYWRSEP